MADKNIQKIIRTILIKICSMIRIFLSYIKKHSLSIQLIFVICCIIFFSGVFYVWYNVPHKSVTYTTKTLGRIGTAKFDILIDMNYGEKKIKKDSTGFAIHILHPLRENSPYLFKGRISSDNVERKDRYIKEYEPLCYKYCSAIDSISTVYKNTITIESNLYDIVHAKNCEYWSNKREVAIWHHPIIIRNKTITENECWFYLKRKLDTWNPLVDTVGLEHRLINTVDNFFPEWYSRNDISKLDFELKLENYNFIECREIMIRFNGPYTLSSITMEPDEKGYDYIRITNPFKLEVINRKGLRFYASFPKLERMQQIRITAILLIIPLLISYLVYVLKKIFINNKNPLKLIR